MHDYMCQHIAEGDTVVYLAPNRRSLSYGVVIKETPEGVTIRDKVTKFKVNRNHSLVLRYKRKDEE